MALQTIERRLVEKLGWAWDEGCPVAGSHEQSRVELAALARRRWFSYQRRQPKKPAEDLAGRVEDLARGLCEKCEEGGLAGAGPLLTDYRWLAEQLAEVLIAEP